VVVSQVQISFNRRTTGDVSTGNAFCGWRADEDERVLVGRLADGLLPRWADAARDDDFTPPGRPGAAPRDVRRAEVEVDREVVVACERVPRRDPSLVVMACPPPKLSGGQIHQEAIRFRSPHQRQPCPLLLRLQQQSKLECSQWLLYDQA